MFMKIIRFDIEFNFWEEWELYFFSNKMFSIKRNIYRLKVKSRGSLFYFILVLIINGSFVIGIMKR